MKPLGTFTAMFTAPAGAEKVLPPHRPRDRGGVCPRWIKRGCLYRGRRQRNAAWLFDRELHAKLQELKEQVQ